MARRFNYLGMVEGLEKRPHLEQVEILQQLLRRKPKAKPPFEYLDLSVSLGILNKESVTSSIREALDTQGVRFEMMENRRLLGSRIRFRAYLDDWHALMVYLAVEQSLRKFVKAVA